MPEKDPRLTTPARDNYRMHVRRVLLQVLVLNLTVVVGKLVIGWRARSLSILSDAAHSSVDSLNNIVGLIIIGYATAAPDTGHPYGHRKIESLAAFALGGLLLFTCFEIAASAIRRLLNPEMIKVQVSQLTLIVMIATIAINVIVYLYERQRADSWGAAFFWRTPSIPAATFSSAAHWWWDSFSFASGCRLSIPCLPSRSPG